MARADIYIRKENEKVWAEVDNKSEWVNKLLELVGVAGSDAIAPLEEE